MVLINNMQFSDAPWHHGVLCANTEEEFINSDDKKHFDINSRDPVYYEYFKQHGWLEPRAITYKINSHGFRCDEFDTDLDSLVALGCSFTMGIGLPLQDTWPQLVGKALNLKPYTLAWGGSSADTCFRLAEYWIPRLKPKLVVMLTPPYARFELLTGSGTVPAEVFLPNSESDWPREFDSYLKHWFTNEDNAGINSRKNKLAIMALCNGLKIPCLIQDSNDHMSWSREKIGYARDRMHAGTRGHELLTEKIVNEWHKNNYT